MPGFRRLGDAIPVPAGPPRRLGAAFSVLDRWCQSCGVACAPGAAAGSLPPSAAYCASCANSCGGHRDVNSLPYVDPRLVGGPGGMAGLAGRPRGFRGMRGTGASPGLVHLPGVGDLAPIAPNPATFVRVPVPSGPGGTQATQQVIGQLALAAAADPYFSSEARSIVRQCQARDYDCFLQAIMDYIIQPDANGNPRVSYLSDPIAEDADGQELDYVQSPGYTLFVVGTGDCDDLTCLIDGIILSIGSFGAGERAVCLDASRPGEASHIYALAYLPDGRTVAMDAVPPNAAPGVEPPRSLWLCPPMDYVIAGG